MRKIIGILFLIFIFVVSSTSLFKDLLNRFELSRDSKHYISTAEHLLKGDGFYMASYADVEIPKMPYINWPPLYPSLIAFLGFLGCDLVEAARLISSFFFAALIFPVYRLINKIIDNILFSVILSALIAYILPLIELANHAWTETPFIFFSYMALSYMIDFTRREDGDFKKDFFLGAFFVTLSCLTRWTGLLLVFCGAFFILFKREFSLRKKIYNSSFFILISSFLIFLWCYRTVYIDSLRHVFGTGKTINSQWYFVRYFGRNFLLTFRVISADLFRLELPFIDKFIMNRHLLDSIKSTLTGFSLLFCVFYSLKKSSWRTKTLFIYLLFYILFIVTSVSIYPLDPMATRYTGPAYPAITIFISVLVYNNVGRFTTSGKMMKFAITILGLFYICLLYSQNKWIYLKVLEFKEVLNLF